MLKFILIILLTISISMCYAQGNYKGSDYGISGGVSNYLGDIGGKKGVRRDGLADMRLSFTRWTFGGFYRYTFSPTFAFKSVLSYIRLYGDDARTQNPARRARNLNFKNDIFEFTGNTELYLYRVNDIGNINSNIDFHLYLTVGIGLFYSNPKGENVNGEWVSLQPLKTEGVSYNKLNLVLPIGGGFYYTLSERCKLGLEMIWRTTFTDYIDDISTTYISDYDGISNKTNEELLNKINDELKTSIKINNFDMNSKRGDRNNNDSYLTVIVNFSYSIFKKKNTLNKQNGLY